MLLLTYFTDRVGAVCVVRGLGARHGVDAVIALYGMESASLRCGQQMQGLPPDNSVGVWRRRRKNQSFWPYIKKNV